MSAFPSSSPTSSPTFTLMSNNVISSMPSSQPTFMLTYTSSSSSLSSYPTSQPSSYPTSQPTSIPTHLMQSDTNKNFYNNENFGFHLVMTFVILLGIGMMIFVISVIRKSYNGSNNIIRKHLSPISLEMISSDNINKSTTFKSKRLDTYFNLEEEDKEILDKDKGELYSATRIIQSNPTNIQLYSNKISLDEETGNPLIQK